MKDISSGHLYDRLHNKKGHYPWSGLSELTYRCNLNCIHCYCKGSEEKNQNNTPHAARRTLQAQKQNIEQRELTTEAWKKVLDEIHKEGCLWLTFSGGEPLVRDDFLEIYSYAKKKGFIITIFTNGTLFTDKIIDYLVKSPPYSIEITLNGITKKTYEAITQTKGTFSRVMKNIKRLKDKGFSLILKSNCLKQNKDEIHRVKRFTEELFGRAEGKYKFRYDPLIQPRLNRDAAPTNFRLSPEELSEVKKSDPEIWDEYERDLCSGLPDLGRDREFLYYCNTWMSQFFVNPYGRLKFCQFSEKFSSDLTKESFREGFYYRFPLALKERFKTNSKCRDCPLRPICYHCPARNLLETGDEETPVPYYCELAKAREQEMLRKVM